MFDPSCVAAALRDARERSAAAVEIPLLDALPARASFFTAPDREVIGQLLPREAYDYWRGAGYFGTFCLTFLLRHAVAALSLAAHGRALARSGLGDRPGECGGAPSDNDALEMFDMPGPSASRGFTVLGFSALGIHLLQGREGCCRAFDAYDLPCCSSPAEGLFCRKHAGEAWWVPGSEGGSTQARMFRFYGSMENLTAYGEEQIRELVGRFWLRMSSLSNKAAPPEASVSEALAFFDCQSVAELGSWGPVMLRRRYAELARLMHPDLGGGNESFLELRRHYEILRDRMCWENAGRALPSSFAVPGDIVEQFSRTNTAFSERR